MVPCLCALDTMSVDWMGGRLYRTKTLATGGDCCDSVSYTHLFLTLLFPLFPCTPTLSVVLHVVREPFLTRHSKTAAAWLEGLSFKMCIRDSHWSHRPSGFSISESNGLCPIFRAHICPMVLLFLFSGARSQNISYSFLRVRKTPASAAIRTKGARRTKARSKAWMTTPMTAVSGAL